MEDHRPLKFIGILTGTFLMFPFFVNAYSAETTHPALTQESVKLFNEHYNEEALSDKEMRLVMKGSTEEDHDTRPLKHFYDPIYKRGLVLGKEWQSSKEWAQDTKAQGGIIEGNLAGIIKGLFEGRDDYSWERAIYEYAWGDKEYALEALGHIIHLLQDATVPDHTRNDPHPPAFELGSPYEGWTAQFSPENIEVDVGDKRPIIFNDLETYFEVMAGYSNYNFFSKDTIFAKEYSNPSGLFEKTEVLKNNKKIIFLLSNNKSTFYRLAGRNHQFEWKEVISSEKEYFIKDPENLILSDYWNLLSQQAVVHGAGVIKLFFNEVEKELESKELYAKNRSWYGKLVDKTRKGLFNVTGALYGTSLSQTDLEELNEETPIPTNTVSSLPPRSTPQSESNAVVEEQPASNTEAREPEEQLENSKPETDSIPDISHEDSIRDDDIGAALESEKKENKIKQHTPDYGGAFIEPPVVSSNEDKVDTEEEEETNPSTPPNISLSIDECGASLSEGGCVLSPNTITLSWNSSSEELSHYIVDDGSSVSTTTATTTGISITENGTYIFAVGAYDNDGESATSTREVEINARPVVINEIAWMGTATSSSDEWIELYNTTSKPISLSNWTLLADDGVPYIPLSKTISPGGYYLIERGEDDTAISDIEADLAIPFSGIGSGSGLENGGEALSLVYVIDGATTTVDTVKNCNDWCGGSNSLDRTMERFDAYANGDEELNWGTALGEFIVNGFDANGEAIGGTPGIKNSISYQMTNSSTLFSDLTLTKVRSPYLVPRDSFTIQSGATLTLKEGVVIKFVNPNRPHFRINGTLITKGTAEDPVVITSFFDDEYGGDLNGDGICDPDNASSTAGCPFAGAWGELWFTNANSGSSLLHTIIRYGSKKTTGQKMHGLITVENTDIMLDSVTIDSSGEHGLYLENSNSTITNSVFKNSTTETVAAGMFIKEGSPSVSKSIFNGNTYGVTVENAPEASLFSNTFTNNINEGVKVTGPSPTISGNSGSGNGYNAITLTGFITNMAEAESLGHSTTTLLSNPLSYLLLNEIQIAASTTLTFDEGVVVKGSGGWIHIRNGGRLSFSGDNTSSLILTSINDDSVGSDITSLTDPPQAGDWSGINVRENGILDISGFTLKYAGGPKSSSSGAGIKLINLLETTIMGTTTISNALIDNNYEHGLQLENGRTLVLSNVTFSNHRVSKVAPSVGLFLKGGTFVGENVVFSDNEVDIDAEGSVSASCVNCGVPITDPEGLLD